MPLQHSFFPYFANLVFASSRWETVTYKEVKITLAAPGSTASSRRLTPTDRTAPKRCLRQGDASA